MPIHIVLADDHPVVRRGIRALLEAERDFTIVGEAGDGVEAERIVDRVKPDVLVLDIRMPKLTGLEVLRIVRQKSPKTQVVVLSMYDSNAFVAESLQNGAAAYVLKDCREGDLVHAVREAVAGRRFLSPPLTLAAIDNYIKQCRAAPFDPHETLTPRERQVLQLSAEGLTSPVIAAKLHISHRTVENHRAHLMRKLKLQNLSELIRYALKHNLIQVV